MAAVCKDLNHRIKYNKFNLPRDIKKNPGPVIDATKQSWQDNVAWFSLNAGSQCAAMALTSLIYNYRNGIKFSLDLLNIMNVTSYMTCYVMSILDSANEMFVRVFAQP